MTLTWFLICGRIHELAANGDVEGLKREISSNTAALNQPDPDNEVIGSIEFINSNIQKNVMCK